MKNITNELTNENHTPFFFYYPRTVIELSKWIASKSNDYSIESSLILIVTTGKCIVSTSSDQLIVQAGNVAHFNNAASITLVEKSQLQGVVIEYVTAGVSNKKESPFQQGLMIEHASTRLVQLADQLLEQWNIQNYETAFSIQQVFSDLLAELYRNSQLNINDKSEDWLQKILLYIGKRYNSTITRSDMAELAGVSPEHFSRVFHKEIGQTFNSHLNLLRIRKAQQLLLTQQFNLSQLALEVGYEEGTYLSRKFKQVVGTSPSVYIRKEKRVVSLNYNYTACLRALGIMPELAPYSHWLASREHIPQSKHLSIEHMSFDTACEAITAVRPDVIINYCIEQENAAMLPIAPVIAIPFRQMCWRDQFHLISEVVNRRNQADVWLQKYDDLCLDLNNDLNRRNTTRGSAIVWEFGDQKVYCYDSSYGRGCHILYGELNYHRPDLLMKEKINERGYLEKNIEDIVLYPADVIIFLNLPYSLEEKLKFKRLTASDNWLKLDAVRNKQVHFLKESSMFYGFDPLSSLAQIEKLSEVLTS
ncbi:helix-turn-helix domain-containing protein [Paenibacillus sp. T3-5-0-4]|nr:helix-turn-helix domain-containing protein [Paenibacillus endoradicis]